MTLGEQQQHVHFVAVPGAGEARDLRLRLVDPERVGVADEKRLAAEFVEHLDDAAALIEQQVALVRNFDARRLPVAQMIFDLVGEPMDVDDGLAHARLVEAVERVIEHGLAADAHQRLGQGQRDRTHPRAEARREHQRLFRSAAHAPSSGANSWGRYWSNQAFRSASAGWPRFFRR